MIWNRTPRGILSKSQYHVALALADSAAFRELTKSPDQAAALKRIHPEYVDCEKNEHGEISLLELHETRPYGQVAPVDAGITIVSNSTSGFTSSRDIAVFFAANACDLGETDNEALAEFNDLVGLILVEMAQNSNKAPYSTIRRVHLQIAPRMLHSKDQQHLGKYFFSLAIVTTGDQ